MVKILILCLSALSFFVSAETIHINRDSDFKRDLPVGVNWVVTDYSRVNCDVCTTDIIIKSGGVSIAGVWVYGEFNFSLDENIEFIFAPETKFSLGDVMNSIDFESRKLKYNKWR